MEIQPKDKPVVISAENYTKKNIFKYSFVNPKILGLLTVVLLMVVGVGAGVYMTQVPGNTQTQATLQLSDISFKPSEVKVEAGSNFNIDVFSDANGNQITSAQLAIEYNPEFLDLTSITPKQFLPKILTPPSIASGSATVSLGTQGNSGISGSGILATLSFKAKLPVSSTQISFDKSQTRVNILGNTASPLKDFKSAVIVINPGASGPPEPVSSPSASIQTQQTQDSPAPASAGINFDFNSDSEINSIDLSILLSAWGNPQTDLQKKADLNGDGIVNGLDYSLFLPHLNK